MVNESLLEIDRVELSMNREQYYPLVEMWVEIGGFKVKYIQYKHKWMVLSPDGVQCEIDFWWLVDIAESVERKYKES